LGRSVTCQVIDSSDARGGNEVKIIERYGKAVPVLTEDEAILCQQPRNLPPRGKCLVLSSGLFTFAVRALLTLG
jgi:hypothetical protein